MDLEAIWGIPAEGIAVAIFAVATASDAVPKLVFYI